MKRSPYFRGILSARPFLQRTTWSVSDFFYYLDAYFKQTKDHHLYERYLQICMPYAFTEYSQLLYAQQRYAEWIEIHSLVGFSISELEKDLIKQIAKEEPEALIPSYHREIHSFSIKRIEVHTENL
ncbi:hypothetical protein ACEQPO_27065 [Bacillus sp. SL00103]